MKVGLAAAATLLTPGVAPVRARTTTLNFDDGTNNALVGGYYSAFGVTFVDATWTNVLGCCGPKHSSANFQPQPSTAIWAHFSSSMSSVTLFGRDVGHHGFRLSAYDAFGALLDTDVVFGSGLGVGQIFALTVTGSDIRKIAFSQDRYIDGDGIVFDDLQFTRATGVVPEPASVALVATGLVAVGALVRRRRA
jgi:hypothetical protein